MTKTHPAVRAERVRLSNGDRRVFPAVTFEAPTGSLVAVLGASGTGKTALLLTLAGRMRGWHGRVVVDGIDATAHGARVRHLVGLGLMPGVNDFAEALTPRQHVTEQHVFVPRAKRSPRADVLARLGLEAVADTQTKHLDAEQRIRLGIALALVRDVSVIVVDDLDRDLNQEERASVLEALRSLAAEGLTIVIACVDSITATQADIVVSLEAGDAVVQEVTRDEVA